jgi:hypothetical protein
VWGEERGGVGRRRGERRMRELGKKEEEENEQANK